MPSKIRSIVGMAYKHAMEAARKRTVPWTDREFLGEFCTQLRRMGQMEFNARNISGSEHARLIGMCHTRNWVRPGVPESWIRDREDFEFFIPLDGEPPTQPPSITSGFVPVDTEQGNFLRMEDAIAEVLKLSRRVEGLTSDGRVAVNGLKLAMDQLLPDKAA